MGIHTGFLDASKLKSPVINLNPGDARTASRAAAAKISVFSRAWLTVEVGPEVPEVQVVHCQDPALGTKVPVVDVPELGEEGVIATLLGVDDVAVVAVHAGFWAAICRAPPPRPRPGFFKLSQERLAFPQRRSARPRPRHPR